MHEVQIILCRSGPPVQLSRSSNNPKQLQQISAWGPLSQIINLLYIELMFWDTWACNLGPKILQGGYLKLTETFCSTYLGAATMRMTSLLFISYISGVNKIGSQTNCGV